MTCLRHEGVVHLQRLKRNGMKPALYYSEEKHTKKGLSIST